MDDLFSHYYSYNYVDSQKEDRQDFLVARILVLQGAQIFSRGIINN